MSTKDTVYAWFNERLAGGAIARDTDAYNQAFTSLPDLIDRLDPDAAVAKIAADEAALAADEAAEKQTPDTPAA